MAGFGSDPGNFFLKRASIPVPEALQKAIFPWVDEWSARYVKAFGPGKPSFADGGIDHPDIAGKNFLEVLRFFRIVVLQDSAVLQAEYPRNPLWTAKVFQHPLWRPFADEGLVAHRVPDAPLDESIERAMPRVAAAVNNLRDELLTHSATEGQQTRKELAAAKFWLADQLTDHVFDLRAQLDWG